MAVRTWANSLVIATSAGLLAGAGQLGVVYGLGIVRWDREFATAAPWHAQLAWVAFIGSVAVIAGALTGTWQARRMRQEPTIALRTALAFAGAVGATVVLPLVARPAATTHLAEAGDPKLSAILATCVGLVIGLMAAVAVLCVPPVSGSVVATVLWVWLAALISAAVTLGRGASWATAGLGLLPAGGIWLPVTLLGPAILIALVVAAVARFGGADPRAVAVCGLAGPTLIGFAYLVAGPGGGSQTTAYRYALLAVCAGFAVSALAAVARRRRPQRSKPLALPSSPEPGPLPARDRAAAADTSPTGPSTADYGWPEPEPADTGPDSAGADNDAEPATADPGVSEATPTPKATSTSETMSISKATPTSETMSTSKATPTSETRATAAKTPRRRATKATKGTTAPEPASLPRPEPAPNPALAADQGLRTADQATPPAEMSTTPAPQAASGKPAKAPRLGRRGRREPEPEPEPEPQSTKPAKSARPKRASKAEVREDDHIEDDHIDWVKSLGGSPSIRVGGSEPARHARTSDAPDPLDDEL